MKNQFDLRNEITKDAEWNLRFAIRNGLTPVHFIIPSKYKPLYTKDPKKEPVNLEMLGHPVVFSTQAHVVDLKVKEEMS